MYGLLVSEVKYIAKNICIYGNYSFDITIYLSIILRNLSKRVLVADYSREDNLYFFSMQDSCEKFTHKNIDFLKLNSPVSLSNDLNNSYDYIFYIIKDMESFKKIGNLDYHYCVTDIFYNNIKNIMSFVRYNLKIDGLIFRNIPYNGFDSLYIIKGIEKDDYLIKLYEQDKIMEIKYCEIEYEYYISLLYEGIGRYKHLSKEYVHILVKILLNITDNKKDTILKAIGKMKEGKLYEHSILE